MSTSPAGTRPATILRYVRSRKIGYSATKIEEKTPATTDSQVTRTLERYEAKKRLRVATRAEERVLPLTFSFCRMQAKMMASGVIPIRAS